MHTDTTKDMTALQLTADRYSQLPISISRRWVRVGKVTDSQVVVREPSGTVIE